LGSGAGGQLGTVSEADFTDSSNDQSTDKVSRHSTQHKRTSGRILSGANHFFGTDQGTRQSMGKAHACYRSPCFPNHDG
jgi:hypothetical protein